MLNGTATGVRDFLMRVALYQATEFGRDDIRREARFLLRQIDTDSGDLLPAPVPAEKVPDTPDIRQGEREVNPGFRQPGGPRQPDFPAYFPRRQKRRKPAA